MMYDMVAVISDVLLWYTMHAVFHNYHNANITRLGC